jgi:hypothetical protein
VAVTSSARIVVHSFQEMIARAVIEDGGEVVPPPTIEFEAGEVGLPGLVGAVPCPELVGGLDDDEGGAGNQIMGLHEPING